ncbi:MAG: GNAT family N-acetyltransferase [Marinobacter sp.]
MSLIGLKAMFFNCLKSFTFRLPASEKVGCYTIKPMSLVDAWHSVGLFHKVFDDESYSIFKAAFLLLVGRRFSTCIRDENKKIVAFQFCRLGNRDLVEGTIHESFIGVHPDHAGRGLATSMRWFSVKSFKNNDFAGISSRVSLSNLGSLKSAENVGFCILESYLDGSGRQEAYLILRFDE